MQIPEPLLLESAPAASVRFAPRFGELDLLLRQLADTLAGIDEEAGARLYRESLERALAAHAHAGHLLTQALPTGTTTDPLDDARLRRALDYIHDRLADDLSLETMAREATMSGSQFARAFRAATGRSPLQYVIDERIRLAKVLLRTTTLPIARVGWRTGYRDAAHFSRQFRRRTDGSCAR